MSVDAVRKCLIINKRMLWKQVVFDAPARCWLPRSIHANPGSRDWARCLMYVLMYVWTVYKSWVVLHTFSPTSMSDEWLQAVLAATSIAHPYIQMFLRSRTWKIYDHYCSVYNVKNVSVAQGIIGKYLPIRGSQSTCCVLSKDTLNCSHIEVNLSHSS